MKLLKIVGLSAFILFLHTSILGIPFADMKTCELPNGDKVKTRTTKNWYLLKGLNPHGSAWGGERKSGWYNPENLLSPNVELLSLSGECYTYGFFGGVVNIANKGLTFKQSQSKHFSKLFTDQNTYNQLKSSHIVTSKSGTRYRETISEITKKGYDVLDQHIKEVMSFVGFFEGKFYFETPLINTPRDAIVDDMESISAVWQSYTVDGGENWSKPIVTQDAKLFVIGKSIKNQPGVAKDIGTLEYIRLF